MQSARRVTDDELDGLRDRAEVIAREAGALLMSAFRSPLLESLRTYVYAVPAAKPEKK